MGKVWAEDSALRNMEFSEQLMKQINFGENGLVPCIAVDFQTKVVLMQAYMNREALQKTLMDGQVTYFSRSRQSLWTKGETSGHFQKLKAMYLDCDQDAVLVEVDQIGVACHTGSKSCFYEDAVLASFSTEILRHLKDTIRNRSANPIEGSYTNYLLEKGIDKILKKVGEESAEVIIASKNNAQEVIYETADLIYHLLVLYQSLGIDFDEVFMELNQRKVVKPQF